VNNLPKVALDCAVAGIKPAISSCKSNALTGNHYPSAGICLNLQTLKNLSFFIVTPHVSCIHEQHILFVYGMLGLQKLAIDQLINC